MDTHYSEIINTNTHNKNVTPTQSATGVISAHQNAESKDMDMLTNPNKWSHELTTSTSAPALRLLPVPRHKECRSLNFAILGPVAISLEEDDLGNPGCSVLDILFPGPSQIGEIVFRNFYTAWVTILAYFQPGTNAVPTNSNTESVNKVIGPLPAGAKPLSPPHMSASSVTTVSNNSEKMEICEWFIVLPRRDLMPNPHYELGSHDLFTIPATDSLVVMKNIRALRLILHQPSPMWNTFFVEELNVYSDVRFNALPKIPHSHPITERVYCTHYDPLLALVRHQTMGAIFKNRCTLNTNAPPNFDPPTYEFFSLPQV